MLKLEFSYREMTALEIYYVENATRGSAILDCLSFIQSRAEGVTDGDAMLRALCLRPASDIRRLFNEALRKALPATDAAVKAVDDEFKRRDESAEMGADDAFDEFIQVSLDSDN